MCEFHLTKGSRSEPPSITIRGTSRKLQNVLSAGEERESTKQLGSGDRLTSTYIYVLYKYMLYVYKAFVYCTYIQSKVHMYVD